VTEIVQSPDEIKIFKFLLLDFTSAFDKFKYIVHIYIYYAR